MFSFAGLVKIRTAIIRAVTAARALVVLLRTNIDIAAAVRDMDALNQVAVDRTMWATRAAL
jgi:hypothetical protein